MRLIKLDDWVDGRPDSWDYEAVLRDNDVLVEWDNEEPQVGYYFSWKHGTCLLGCSDYIQARKAAAVFVSLWLLGVSASFAIKLTRGYLLTF
jgi:hypothetical protein